ncbi:hypothetical protein ACJQWK_00926 [Exserohilum turcicum]|uniref:Uncharacterized protein n=1 Tax=Exserohilum turcicum (strain 28A) TaxID=671987 RepID=R0JTG8_EXST2|nr:uncharacterized protein SETTUDRAFT_33355 [Exserohilum turcica Et28A]EOA84368.1 hypothetical protein SETTUDRAFT_33355 [Exserohilum turcica Et28A]
MKLLSSLLAIAAALSPIISALSVTSTRTWNITSDVQGSVRLNGLSFQQNALLTYGNYQYVAFYATATGYGKHYVNLGRRKISPQLGDWQYFAFTDYVQTTFDEHNTISMGISGDGKIHLSFDHHDTVLNYRVSKAGLATDVPAEWTASAFGPVLHELEGLPGPWSPVTYPRFVSNAGGNLFFEFRIGKSGAGDSYLHQYTTTGQWSSAGKYIEGDNNNAYLNGINVHEGILHVSWTVRETPDASTNHDFYYAQSDQDGRAWNQTNFQAVSYPIRTTDPKVRVFAIPQNSQIINQEGQFVDGKGRFHALMRDNTTGTAQFYHYLRVPTGGFSKTPIKVPGLSAPPYLSYRGKIVASGDNLIAVLPDQPKMTIQIWTSTAGGSYTDWKKLAEIPNSAGEPLVDEERLTKFSVLSLFVRQGGPFPERKIQVWDFSLSS